jgi:hypothetical protein
MEILRLERGCKDLMDDSGLAKAELMTFDISYESCSQYRAALIFPWP